MRIPTVERYIVLDHERRDPKIVCRNRGSRGSQLAKEPCIVARRVQSWKQDIDWYRSRSLLPCVLVYLVMFHYGTISPKSHVVLRSTTLAKTQRPVSPWALGPGYDVDCRTGLRLNGTTVAIFVGGSYLAAARSVGASAYTSLGWTRVNAT